MLPGSPQLTFFRPGPATRNGLSLSCNDARFHEHHSRVNGPDLPLRYLATGIPARSAFQLHDRHRFAPAPAASKLLARCSSACCVDSPPSRSPLPFGAFAPLRIKAFDRIGRLSARLPNPPDLPSLPAAVSFSRCGDGSPFQVRYVSGGLLFLKPLGTSFTMIPKLICRQRVFVRPRPKSSTSI